MRSKGRIIPHKDDQREVVKFAWVPTIVYLKPSPKQFRSNPLNYVRGWIWLEEYIVTQIANRWGGWNTIIGKSCDS